MLILHNWYLLWNTFPVTPYKVVLCEPVEQILRRVHDKYLRMLAGKSVPTRFWISITTDYKAMSMKPESLYDSYIFKTYYNGFAGAYKEIHHSNTKELVSPQVFYDFSKSYILSDKIQSLYNEPSSDCRKVRPFSGTSALIWGASVRFYTQKLRLRKNMLRWQETILWNSQRKILIHFLSSL